MFHASHLDTNIHVTTESLIMSSKYDLPYRIDRTNNGGVLLMFLSFGLAHTRNTGLEIFFNESLRDENKVNRELKAIVLVCCIVHEQQMLFSLIS